MFYSRRIESFDYGAKGFGQLNDGLGLGALVTVDTGQQTSGVVRLQQRLNARSAVSAYATAARIDGTNDAAYGLNAYTGHGNYGADTQLALHQGEAETNSAGSFSVSYSVPRIFSILRYQWIEPGFDPSLAYIPWQDRKGAYWFSEYFTQYKTGPLQSFDANLFLTDYQDYAGGAQQRGGEFYTGFTDRGDRRYNFTFNSMKYYDELDQSVGFGLVLNRSNRFRRYSFFVSSGTLNGSPASFFNVEASLRVLKKLDIGISASLFEWEGTAQQTIVTLGYEFSPTSSLISRSVLRDSDFNTYFAFRESGGRGLEYYVILGDPNAARTQNRVSVKLVYAF
jgi:hypothetical protein